MTAPGSTDNMKDLIEYIAKARRERRPGEGDRETGPNGPGDSNHPECRIHEDSKTVRPGDH